MKKIIANSVAGIVLVYSVAVLLLQGFGLPPISSNANLVLRILAAAAAQVLFCVNFKQCWLRVVPLVLTVAFALWGGWAFLTSDSWVNATLPDYFADYCTPAIGCFVVYIFSLIVRSGMRKKR